MQKGQKEEERLPPAARNKRLRHGGGLQWGLVSTALAAMMLMSGMRKFADAQEFSARVNLKSAAKGHVGHVNFYAESPSSLLSIEVGLRRHQLTDPAGYRFHIHERPVAPPDDTGAPYPNCTTTGPHLDPDGRMKATTGYKCNSTDYLTCEVGDLSGKFGTLFPNQTSPPKTFEDLTPGMADPSRPERYILGRSVVLHAPNGERIACGTIESTISYSDEGEDDDEVSDEESTQAQDDAYVSDEDEDEGEDTDVSGVDDSQEPVTDGDDEAYDDEDEEEDSSVDDDGTEAGTTTVPPTTASTSTPTTRPTGTPTTRPTSTPSSRTTFTPATAAPAQATSGAASSAGKRSTHLFGDGGGLATYIILSAVGIGMMTVVVGRFI